MRQIEKHITKGLEEIIYGKRSKRDNFKKTFAAIKAISKSIREYYETSDDRLLYLIGEVGSANSHSIQIESCSGPLELARISLKISSAGSSAVVA